MAGLYSGGYRGIAPREHRAQDDLPRSFDIAPNLLDERRYAIERCEIPQIAGEEQPKRPLVFAVAECLRLGQRSGPIKDVSFEGPRSISERVARADMNRRGKPPPIRQLGISSVHAIGRQSADGVDVRGRKTQFASAPVAPDHFSDNLIGAPKQPFGVADASVGDQPANHGARGRDDGLVGQGRLDRVHDGNFESVRAPEAGKQIDIPFAPAAESEVAALDDSEGSVLGNKACHELGRRLVQHASLGHKTDDVIRARFAQPAGTIFEGAQTCDGGLRAQHRRGMGIEGQHDDPPRLAGGRCIRQRAGTGDQGRVADMHAVKVADGQNGPDGHEPQHYASGRSAASGTSGTAGAILGGMGERLLPGIPADKRWLIVVAARVEAAAVARGLGDEGGVPEEDWMIRPLGRESSKTQFEMVVSGVGKANAAGAAARCLDPVRHAGVLSLGVGGALPGGGCSLLDVVVATRSIFADEGVECEEGFQSMTDLGLASSMGVEADAELVKRFAGAGWRLGPVATVSTCSGTDELAARIAARTGAIAEAMEGAAVGCALGRLGGGTIRFAELRTISNTTGKRSAQRWNLQGALEVLSRVAASL